MSTIKTPAELELFSEAFLGYRLASNGLFIGCCSACPGKYLVERMAASGKTRVPVTHGLCTVHFNQQMEELKLA